VRTLDVRTLQAQDLCGLSTQVLVMSAEQMLQRIGAQSKLLDERDERIVSQARAIKFMHVDETPVNMLDPGAGKAKRACIWAHAHGRFDAPPGVANDFCVGRAAKYPIAFLGEWSGTLVRDECSAHDSVARLHERMAAGCLAHARRKFDERIKDNRSSVATQAVQRIAMIYRVEHEARELSAEDRLAAKQTRAQLLWDGFFVWLKLARSRFADGSAIARALDDSLNHWAALTTHLLDGRLPVDNNLIENLLRPWAMCRKAWRYCGSERASQRAAVAMSLLMSAKLNGHDPWAYLKDLLTGLPTHLNGRIEKLLPHRWQPLA